MSKVHLALCFGVAGLLVGCDSQEAASEPAVASAKRSEAPTSSPRGDSAKTSMAEPAVVAGPAEMAGASADVARAPAAAPMTALGESKASDRAGHRVVERRVQPAPSAGLLTAGRWSDRDDWSRWEGLLAPASEYHHILEAWHLGQSQRVAVTLRGNGYLPADTEVVLEDDRGQTQWRARTDNRGRADLYLPPNGSGRLLVRGADGALLASRQVSAGEDHELRTSNDVAVASALDLMFVVDTTGSMGDELSFLQTELSDIVARVQQDSAQDLVVRTSVNFYRDHGDDYVVRSHPFTTDMNQTLSQLRAQQADGGGDFPEALDAALANGVAEHQWSDSAVARLMFVVTDAPPHDGARIGQNLQNTVSMAAAKGIRIVPIASSGVDKPSEFVLRHMAVSTGGTYVFLTDHSGVGNSHIEPTVGPHVVKPLNDLIVEVIGEYTQTEQLLLVAPQAQATLHAQGHEQPCGYAVGRLQAEQRKPWIYGGIAMALLLPLGLAGLWWRRRGRVALPAPDVRVTRAQRLVDEVTRLAKTSDNAEARSWSPHVREVAEGIEQLTRQRQAIDASLRSAGAPLTDGDIDGMRGDLRAQIAQRRQAIDAEIDSGLLSIEAAYLHVIGGVGHRSTAQANLDAAREALQTRLEVERELRVD